MWDFDAWINDKKLFNGDVCDDYSSDCGILRVTVEAKAIRYRNNRTTKIHNLPLMPFRIWISILIVATHTHSELGVVSSTKAQHRITFQRTSNCLFSTLWLPSTPSTEDSEVAMASIWFWFTVNRFVLVKWQMWITDNSISGWDWVHGVSAYYALVLSTAARLSINGVKSIENCQFYSFFISFHTHTQRPQFTLRSRDKLLHLKLSLQQRKRWDHRGEMPLKFNSILGTTTADQFREDASRTWGGDGEDEMWQK